jgi:phthalate 4,5-dioxygenase
MLSKEDNDLLTRVDPGTPMGNLMREYWIPCMLSSELPAPDSEPVRVLILSEKLIAFRDSNGRISLLANNCPHRGASLFFGRNEEAGLRCVYHGWKFDAQGNCVDMPNEPAESDFRTKVKAVAYPCEERGGIVWTYMGSRAVPPPLPNIESNMVAGGEARAVQRECNWLQGLEGDIDTSHTSFLHSGSIPAESYPEGTFRYYIQKHRDPRYAVVDTECGTMYGAYRDAQAGHDYWRAAQFMFPFYTMPPGGVMGLPHSTQVWVPMDNDHMMLFRMWPRPAQPRLNRDSTGETLLPNTSDWYGRFRLESNAANDYRIERDLQRSNTGAAGYTGIHGTLTQDQAITESMGHIYDRSQEHLGSSDAMIIRVRRRLLDATRALEHNGVTPPAVDTPDAYLVRSGGVILPKGVDWLKATEHLRQPLSEHPGLAELELSPGWR